MVIGWRDETDPRRRFRKARDELEACLRRGESARAEDYFAADENFLADADAAIELVYAEYVARGERGEDLDPNEFCRRFPSWEADLRDLFQIHSFMVESITDDSRVLEEPARIHPTDERPPRELGHFLLLEEVGRGGMALVYKARDLHLGRLVALKMIRSEARADPGRFQAEAEAVARLQHPNIVQIHEIFEDSGRSFISFEFVDGGNLKDAMNRGPIKPRAASRLIAVLADAVDYAHRRGVAHLDLKPANILMTTDGIPKVVDFGLAKQLNRDRRLELSTAGAERARVAGTFGYMAPEQFSGILDQDLHSADIYSLGAILHELLTGRPPYEVGPFLDRLARGLDAESTRPSTIRPDLPRDLDAVCARCLEPDPSRRYPDAAALANDLRRFLAGEPVQARAVGAWEWCWKWAKRRPTSAALAVICLLAVLGLPIASVAYSTRIASMVQRAEIHRVEAERQARMVGDQLELSRHNLYALQLNHVETNLIHNPGLGLALLRDKTYCPEDLRDFTWGYFLRLCRRKRVDLRGHKLGEIRVVAFAPDGKSIAVAGGVSAGPVRKGQVKLLNPRDELQELGTFVDEDGAIVSMAFSPDGKTLVTVSKRNEVGEASASSGSGGIKLWDLASGVMRILFPGEGSPSRVAFSPDGTLLAVAERDGSVSLRDSQSGRFVFRLSGHRGEVLGLVFSRDGASLATGGSDGTARLWDLASRRAELVLRGHSGSVNAVDLSPDGSFMISAGADKIATVWELSEGRPWAVLRGHQAAVCSAAFSPDGEAVITGGEDCIVKQWRVENGQEVDSLNIHEGPVTSVAFAPSGDIFMSGSLDQTAKVWNLTAGYQRPPLRGHETKVAAAVFSSDGKTLVTAGRDGTIRIRSADGRIHGTIRAAASPEVVLAFSPSDNMLATGGANGTLRLRWLDRPESESISLPGHASEITALVFSPDGKMLASSSLDSSIRLWDPTTGKGIRSLIPAAGGIGDIAFSRDGKRLAAACEDRFVRVWDVETCQEIAKLSGHTQGVASVVFHPDGETLVSGGKDRTIRFWDLQKSKQRLVLWGHNHWIRRILFSPDGRTMASSTGDPGRNAVGEVKLWDAVTGSIRGTVEGQTSPIVFSPDGRALVTSNHDGTINLLEVAEEFVAPRS